MRRMPWKNRERNKGPYMKNPIIRLREMHDFVGNSERIVVEYLLENPSVVLENSIHELAEKIYVSPATIVRLCKRLGFDGYREFRQSLIYELALYQNNERIDKNDIERDDSVESIVDKVTYKNIISLEETRNLIDVEKVKKCVGLLCSCNNILIFGMGASLCVAKDAYLKFLRVNKSCFVVEDWHSQYIQAQNSTTKDIGIFISYSGETAEMIKCLQQINANNTPSILITRFASSTMASLATHVLYTSANESLFRSGATSSRIAQLNMIDILYTAYATANYDQCVSRLNITHIEKKK